MTDRIAPLLMFQNGDAEEAMRFYVSLFEDAEVVRIDRYGPGEPGAEGTVKNAAFRLGGREFQCIDSPPVHAFGFTPSISLHVGCGSEDEFERLWGALSDGGEALMPPDDYGFSRRFGWLNDRFGVSWQLDLQ